MLSAHSQLVCFVDRVLQAMGWTTVLVGDVDRAGALRSCAEADFIIPSLHVLPTVLPQLFEPSIAQVTRAHKTLTPQKTLTPDKREREDEATMPASEPKAAESDFEVVARLSRRSYSVESC